MHEMADTRGLKLNAAELNDCRTLDAIQRPFTDEDVRTSSISPRQTFDLDQNGKLTSFPLFFRS